MPEPTLSDLAEKIDRGFAHDERLRAVEQKTAVLETLPDTMRQMESRLVAAIQENKLKPWPAVGALCSVMIVLMGVFALLYTR